MFLRLSGRTIQQTTTWLSSKRYEVFDEGGARIVTPRLTHVCVRFIAEHCEEGDLRVCQEMQRKQHRANRCCADAENLTWACQTRYMACQARPQRARYSARKWRRCPRICAARRHSIPFPNNSLYGPLEALSCAMRHADRRHRLQSLMVNTWCTSIARRLTPNWASSLIFGACGIHYSST